MCWRASIRIGTSRRLVSTSWSLTSSASPCQSCRSRLLHYRPRRRLRLVRAHSPVLDQQPVRPEPPRWVTLEPEARPEPRRVTLEPEARPAPPLEARPIRRAATQSRPHLRRLGKNRALNTVEDSYSTLPASPSNTNAECDVT